MLFQPESALKEDSKKKQGRMHGKGSGRGRKAKIARNSKMFLTYQPTDLLTQQGVESRVRERFGDIANRQLNICSA